IDMLGLTDAAIARRPVYVASAGWAGHRRGWGAYVVGRRPAAILWYNSAGSAAPFYLGDRELADNPWFRFFYRHRIERLPALGGPAASAPEPEDDPEAFEDGVTSPGLSGASDTNRTNVPASAAGAKVDPEAPGAGRNIAEDANGPDPNDADAESHQADQSPATEPHPSARPLQGGEPPGRSAVGKGSAGESGRARSAGEMEEGEGVPTPGGIIARFLGYPFGFNKAGASWSPELGVRARYHHRPLPWTSFEEAPIEIHWFERDPRDDDLWPLREKHAEDVAGFVRDVAARWASERPQEEPYDASARADVERLCKSALESVKAGRMRLAKEILSRAAALDDAARSPLVYQYMANVAVMTGDILAAVPAQKEALRLDPGNRLYAANLVRLLTTPWEEATKPRPGTSSEAPVAPSP
ncbi:MAG TPA: hypothetical protein VNI57_05235, partial [Candidatus Saccharimonadales bacterium]|nr:hypothetical protein [Candidatus Saccharimonadales bacterium]